MALPRPASNSLHSVYTRLVCGLSVTTITDWLPVSGSAALITPSSFSGVQDRRFEDVYCLCRDSLFSQHPVVAVSFAGILNAKLLPAAGKRSRVSPQVLLRETLMIKFGRFRRASGKIAAQNCNRVGFLQGIFLHQPMTNCEKEEKYADDGQQRQCAQNCAKSQILEESSA